MGYVKHYDRQQELILTGAERLFIQNGIDKTSMLQVAAGCGITRATLYRYYDSKEKLMWGIFTRHTSTFVQHFQRPLQEFEGNTYERFHFVMTLFGDAAASNPDSFIFMDMFGGIYQSATAGQDKDAAKQSDGLQSGELVAFLSRNFHDGSVRDDLDPVATAVSFVYGSLGAIIYCIRYGSAIGVKYKCSAETVIRAHLLSLMDGIKPIE